ncbi:hypothetical protein K440DRAFT_610562 [Wilcoxina mikolae CBS 423.85]|nr:hypothetical protein K440DRAFT_610562 [Wilcoxina mikolae CBS 423.85]
MSIAVSSAALHAISQVTDVQKHRHKHPDPNPGNSCINIGLVNRVNVTQEVKRTEDSVGSFINGVALGAGMVVSLGLGAWLYHKATGKEEKEKEPLFEDGREFDD